MITQILPRPKKVNAPHRSFRKQAKPPSAVAQHAPLLLLSDDELFSLDLLRAAAKAGRTVVRVQPTCDGLLNLQILQPAAVLLDLDSSSKSTWDIADLLLQDQHCPLLLLLTSRGQQFDFEPAIQAGSIIEKGANAAALLEFINLKLDSSKSTESDPNALQRIAIRWLKPCSWSPEVIQLRRFWGINE